MKCEYLVNTHYVNTIYTFTVIHINYINGIMG